MLKPHFFSTLLENEPRAAAPRSHESSGALAPFGVRRGPEHTQVMSVVLWTHRGAASQDRFIADDRADRDSLERRARSELQVHIGVVAGDFGPVRWVCHEAQEAGAIGQDAGAVVLNGQRCRVDEG